MGTLCGGIENCSSYVDCTFRNRVIYISNKNGTPGDRNIGEFYSSSTNLGSIPLPCFIVSFLFNDLALTLNLRGQMMCSNFFVYLNIFKVITLSLFSLK